MPWKKIWYLWNRKFWHQNRLDFIHFCGSRIGMKRRCFKRGLNKALKPPYLSPPNPAGLPPPLPKHKWGLFSQHDVDNFCFPRKAKIFQSWILNCSPFRRNQDQTHGAALRALQRAGVFKQSVWKIYFEHQWIFVLYFY